MPMRFPYDLGKVNKAVISLGGRWVRPRPLVVVTLVGPSGTYVEQGHLDTGCDDTVFEERIASMLGIDLTNAPAGELAGVGGVPHPLRYARITIRVAQGTERREWVGWVGFTPAKLKRPLLGHAGFLQFFTATFRGDREEVELDVNSLYPGN